MKLKLTIVVRNTMTWSEVRRTLIHFTNQMKGTFPDTEDIVAPVKLTLDVRDPLGTRVGSFRVVLDEDED